MIRSLAQRVRRFVSAKSVVASQSEEDYVRLAYLVLLRRPIDPMGLVSWRSVIAAGRFTDQNVIDTILHSEEYLSRFKLLDIIHHARQAWIKTVPAFPKILDIGGSSANLPEGALIELGYSHFPHVIDILDLPPDQQYWGKPKYDQNKSKQFDWGEVNYFHGSAERIEEVRALQERTYDCVFLGQAIEHIYPESLPTLLDWIKRHLVPGGQLVFDTPNRLLTRIQCPDSLTDPDHKYEYTPAEMEQVLINAGFMITERKGMLHLPIQARSGVYDAREFVRAAPVHADADACYLFALAARVADSA